MGQAGGMSRGVVVFRVGLREMRARVETDMVFLFASRSTSEFPPWLVLHLRFDVSTFAILHSLEMRLTFFLCCFQFPSNSESDTTSTWTHQFARGRAPELIEASRKMLSELLVYCCERRCLFSCRCRCCCWRFLERVEGVACVVGCSCVLMWNCSWWIYIDVQGCCNVGSVVGKFLHGNLVIYM